jgi:hypothetical protein
MAKKVYDFDYDRQPDGVWVKIDTDEGNKKGKVNIPTYLTYNQLGTAIKQLLVKQGYDIAIKQPVLDDKILAKAEIVWEEDNLPPKPVYLGNEDLYEQRQREKARFAILERKLDPNSKLRRKEQFAKTLDDLDQIKVQAEFLYDAISSGVDPLDGESINLDYVEVVMKNMKLFADVVSDHYWEECDKVAGNGHLDESLDNLLTNQEFVARCKEEGIDGAEIVLDWDAKQHTYAEWTKLLLTTYLELEQDLLAQGNYDYVKQNRETVINVILSGAKFNEDLKEGRKPGSPYTHFKNYQKGFNDRTLRGKFSKDFNDEAKRLGKIENKAYKDEVKDIKSQVGNDSIALHKLASERVRQHNQAGKDSFNKGWENGQTISHDDIVKHSGRELAAQHLKWSADGYNKAHKIKLDKEN